MKNKKFTLTIGISAYNEEENIGNLLNSILSQEQAGYQLEKILIISDGSTDKTVELVKLIKNDYSKIQLISHSQRKGLFSGQNEIVKKSTSDILILLDADVLPEGDQFIQKLINPLFSNKKIGIVGAETVNAKPRNLIEKILTESREFKKTIYKKINKGNNIYLCHGRARAFSRDLYSRIKWPNNCPEDAYSYLFCLQKGMQFIFNPEAKVMFRAPSKYFEYVNKNARFRIGKNKLEMHFLPELIKAQYHIPMIMLLTVLTQFLLSKPFTTLGYSFLFISARLLSFKVKTVYPVWKVAPSSKIIINEKYTKTESL